MTSASFLPYSFHPPSSSNRTLHTSPPLPGPECPLRSEQTNRFEPGGEGVGSITRGIFLLSGSSTFSFPFFDTTLGQLVCMYIVPLGTWLGGEQARRVYLCTQLFVLSWAVKLNNFS